ncbi:hypothetical protein DSECCO2_423720 [anaerobic digester metagenome]
METCSGLVCHGFCNQGLSGSRWAVEDDSFRRLNVKVGKKFRVLHGHLYHFTDTHDLVTQAPYIFIGGDASCCLFVALYRFFPEFNVCCFGNQDNCICRVSLDSNQGDYLACCQGLCHWLRH